jgi:carboxyl-terminal processing protease
MRALIIDLRRNGGGLLNEAIGISGLFIPEGPVVQVRDSAGQSMSYNDEDPKVAWDGPLILLTSKLSASASEIFAGAMRDHRRALIVGDSTTHGKGTVQNIIELSRLAPQLKSAVKVTIQKWYAPSGSSIQLKGVPADITVPSLFSVMPFAESDLDRPLPWDSVEPMLNKVDEGAWLKAPLSDGLIKRLNDSSRRRQIELPEFSTLSHMLSWTSAKVNRTEVPLSLNTRRNERIEDLAFRESVRKELEAYGKSEPVSKEVNLDAAIAQAKKQTDPNWEKASKSMSRLRGPLEDDGWPEYDIQLTEALHIACDWSMELNKVPGVKR